MHSGCYGIEPRRRRSALPKAHMSLFKTRSAAVYGIDAHLIDVEVDMHATGSARDFAMVGMPDTAVRESRERMGKVAILFRRKGASRVEYTPVSRGNRLC